MSVYLQVGSHALKLSDVVADVDVLIALEQEELGLRILPVLSAWERNPNFSPPRTLGGLIDAAREIPDPGAIGGQTESRHKEIRLALREAWAWLEGAALIIQDDRFLGPHDHRILSRKAKKLACESNFGRAFATRLLQKDVLNRRIREDVWALYHRGKYDTAVFEALKAVEIAVRDAAGYSNDDYGTDMIARAFNEEHGPLRDPNDQKAERIALRNLFIGTHGTYKNLHSHRKVEIDDPVEAAEIIMLANHLLRIVDARAANREASSAEE